MIKNFFNKLFGDSTENELKRLQPLVNEINRIFVEYNNYSNDELRNKSTELKQYIQENLKDINQEITDTKNKADNDDTSFDDKELLYNNLTKLNDLKHKETEKILKEILPQAFALMKETAKRFLENDTLHVIASDYDRELAMTKDFVVIDGNTAIYKNSWISGGNVNTWSMVHYDVQLIGGIILHEGKIAEMKTGEGKTLVATLPVFLNALTGNGVHVVTVNDYLSKRDSEWMGPLYQFHGLTVDCIDKHRPNSVMRKNAYHSDITFGTNNEFGFDYLRDNMVDKIESIVQRKHNYAIVDEVDSVLIDDARTPLIISGSTGEKVDEEYSILKPKIEVLVNSQKKLFNTLINEAKSKLSKENDESIDKKTRNIIVKEGQLALLRAYRSLPKNRALIKFLSEPGIKIHLQKVENFYMQDQSKEMPKVDKELYFVIDEKQNQVDLTEKGIDLISSDEGHDFYILQDIGSLFAEIDEEEISKEEIRNKKQEIVSAYSVKAQRIHSINQLLKAYTLFEKEVEYVLVNNQVKIVDEQTGRIMEGRRYSDGLHQALEAKENVKIEEATQTHATVTLQNFFRMYSKLAGMTGTAETEASEFWDIYQLDVMKIPTNRPVLRNDKPDKFYKTQKAKYDAIIEEIVEMVSENRPVLVGTTSVEISELISRMLQFRKIKHNVLNAKKHDQEAQIVKEAGLPGNVTIATNMAGRGTDIKITDEVKVNGGLAIIGTERHDSRRVDRQLQGRAGRQGDPGTSQFFVSAEDKLMRLFGGDRMARMLNTFGMKDNEMIQMKSFTSIVEKAQKKVEENNFGIRKNLLEYDNVMNSQREAIYSKRRSALFGDKLEYELNISIHEIILNIVADYKENKDYIHTETELILKFGITEIPTEKDFETNDELVLADDIYKSVMNNYKWKKENIANISFPFVKKIYEDNDNKYENIKFPFTDGKIVMEVISNIKNLYNTNCKEIFKEVEKNYSLAVIDENWRHHLREMDSLKQSVQNARFEQKDPVLIYKLESFELFQQMLYQLNTEVLSFLFKANIFGNENVKSTNESKKSNADDINKLNIGREEQNENNTNENINQNREKQAPIIQEKKIDRNEVVTIVNMQSGEEQVIKYKKAESLLNSGNWHIIEK